MLDMEEIESGLFVTHKNTGLRYSVVDTSDEEVLLSPEQTGLQDLTVPLQLFRDEFISTEHLLLALTKVPSKAQDVLKLNAISEAEILEALNKVRGSGRVRSHRSSSCLALITARNEGGTKAELPVFWPHNTYILPLLYTAASVRTRHIAAGGQWPGTRSFCQDVF